MSDELDTVRYTGDEQNTVAFLRAAADAFGAEHCGLPDGMILDRFRRISGLPADLWAQITHGAIPITLYSPGDEALPATLRYVTVGWDEIFCFHTVHALVDPAIESSDSISEQGEPTLHGTH